MIDYRHADKMIQTASSINELHLIMDAIDRELRETGMTEYDEVHCLDLIMEANRMSEILPEYDPGETYPCADMYRRPLPLGSIVVENW